jgi:hypothetical protein
VKNLIQLSDNLIAVIVSKYAKNIQIEYPFYINYPDLNKNQRLSYNEGGYAFNYIPLPPGKWEMVAIVNKDEVDTHLELGRMASILKDSGYVDAYVLLDCHRIDLESDEMKWNDCVILTKID